MLRLLPAFIVTAFLGLAVETACAQPTAGPLPPGLTEVRQVEGIVEYALANGLQVLLVPDDSKPTTTVNLTYRVGSRHESYGETGMAHLLEHLLFKGSPKMPRPWLEFSRRGLRANGTTWFDRTNYFASFAADDDNLRWYLGWQADAMLNSNVARSDLDTEMTVVRNELELGENNPVRILEQRTLAAMYDWHNYGKSTIGARSDVENVDIPRLQAFYRRFYQPDNATLIIAGRFDRARTLGWIAESFGPLPRPSRTLPSTYTLDAAQDGERTVTVRRVGGAPLVMVGYHVPPASHPDTAAVELLTRVLGDAPGGRLHKQLVEQRLAASTSAGNYPLAEPAPLLLRAELAPGQDVERARVAMLATVESLVSEPITVEELERARIQWLNDWDKRFTDPERVGVELSTAIALGDWRLYFLARDGVRKVGLEDVRRVAAERLRRDNRTIGIYLPTATPERAPAPARVDVAAVVKDYRGDPGIAQAEAFEATPANLDSRTQRFSLDSGMRIALLAKGTRGQVVQARLRLHYGDVRALDGQSTVAAFVAAMFDKGGAGMTRQQIADRLDRLHATVSFTGAGQTLNVAIATKRAQLPAVIELVGRLLREPAFVQGPLDELRLATLTSIERQRKEPDALIANLVRRHGDPYPRGDLRHVMTFAEAESDARAVTLARLNDFHRRFYSAAFAEFAAVGDFDAAAVRQSLAAAFGAWRQPAAGPAAYVRAPLPFVAVAPTRLQELTPDRQNANLRGALALPLGDVDADYPALLMANYLFGSGGASRLWKRIREGDGLSYSVRSVIDWNPFEPHSAWTVSAIFAPQNQPRIEAALREEVARSIADGFTREELDQGRSGLLSARRLARAQDGGVAAQLALDQELSRRFDFAEQVDSALERLTLEQVNAAWRKHIDPARMVLGWAGDFGRAP